MQGNAPLSPEQVARYCTQVRAEGFPGLHVGVTGSRSGADMAMVEWALSGLHHGYGIRRLFHGAAPGVDSTADYVARSLGVPEIQPYPAAWETHGKAGGPIRNRAMLDAELRRSRPLSGGTPAVLLLVFPGTRGTADCMVAGMARGIPIWLVAGEYPRR